MNLKHVIILAFISIGYGSAESTEDVTQQSILEDLGKKLVENDISQSNLEESSNDLKTSEIVKKSEDLEVSSATDNEDSGKLESVEKLENSELLKNDKKPENSIESDEIPEDSGKSDEIAAETTEAADMGKSLEEAEDLNKLQHKDANLVENLKKLNQKEYKDTKDLRKLSDNEEANKNAEDLKNLKQEKTKIEMDDAEKQKSKESENDIKDQLKTENNMETIPEIGKSEPSTQQITKRVDKVEDGFRGEDWFDDDEPNYISNRISRPDWLVEQPKWEFPKTNKDTKLPIYKTPFISSMTNSMVSSVLHQHQKPQVLDTHHAEINIYQATPHHTPHIKPSLHHIIVDNEIPKYPYITETIKNIPTPHSPVHFDDEFVKPIIERRKTFWEQLRDQIKNLENKMIIKKKLEILEDYKNKLISTQKAFIDGIKRKFTISIPKISSSGISFENKEVEMF